MKHLHVNGSFKGPHHASPSKCAKPLSAEAHDGLCWKVSEQALTFSGPKWVARFSGAPALGFKGSHKKNHMLRDPL